jgi:stage III sporulation protein AF
MQAIREYILSVITAGLLCAIVGKLLNDKGVPATIGKLLTGIIMMISVLAPFAELSADSVLDLKTEYQTISLDAVQRGEKITSDAMQNSISNSLEAYLLDKAQEMGMELQVEVILSDDLYPIPVKVIISGIASPYGKKRMSQIIEANLGVMEENQVWR